MVKLVRSLATSLMESNVPEVKADLMGQDPVDFDATLFVSSTAAAYLELYKACLQDWTSHSWEQDLSGEVLPSITPINSMHYPNTWLQ